MTTKIDCLADRGPLLQCPLGPGNAYPSLFLALRDLRQAHGRDPETGEGLANSSWIALSLGMIVLDSLTSSTASVGTRWTALLVKHGVDQDDAEIIYATRNALLHGYGMPRPEKVGHRKVLFTGDVGAYALNTENPHQVLLSVPAFCAGLVERIAGAAPQDWDTTLIDTDIVRTL